jgi:hypothetical protein
MSNIQTVFQNLHLHTVYMFTYIMYITSRIWGVFFQRQIVMVQGNDDSRLFSTSGYKTIW